MVFNYLRSLIKSTPIGVFYINHIRYPSTKITITADRLSFTSDEISKEFVISNIYNVLLSPTNNEVSFISDKIHYLFICPQSLLFIKKFIKCDEIIFNKKGSFVMFKTGVVLRENNCIVQLLKKGNAAQVLSKNNFKGEKDSETSAEASILSIFQEDMLKIHEQDVEQGMMKVEDGRIVWNGDNYFCKLKFKRLEMLEFMSKVDHANNLSTTNSYQDTCIKPESPSIDIIEEFSEEDEVSDDYTDIFEISEESDTTNKNLVTSKDHAFVSRGNLIDIFKIDNDVDFLNSITNLKIHNSSVVPDKLINDTFNNKMYLLRRNNKQVYGLDLERGKITEEYCFNNPLMDTTAAEGHNLLTSVSESGIYSMDTRANKIVKENEYKCNNKFRYIHESIGKTAICSKDGAVRLYDDIGKRAKKLVPGYGEEPLHMDYSGKYILLTFKKYLLLNTGDEIIKLFIKPEHAAYMQEEINFKQGVFDNDGERIVVGTGHFIVSYNVDDVINGRVFEYSVKRYNELVVSGRFKSDDIVVALKDDVKKAKTVSMRVPEKIMRERRQRKR